MAVTNNIEKALAGAEDLLLGSGTVSQTRENQTVVVTKLNASVLPYSGDASTANVVTIKTELDAKISLDDNNEIANSLSGAAVEVAAGRPRSVKQADGTWVEAATGTIGNVNDPFVHIPFRREVDELRLSGASTFTRNSLATYIDPLDGVVKVAAVDTPRFEKMPDGGVGILLEGADTNYILNSDYSVEDVTAQVVRTAATIIAPDGTNVLGYETSVGNATDPSVTKHATVIGAVAGRTFTFSVWVKGVGVSVGKAARMFHYESSPAATTFTVPAEWTRITATHTMTGAETGTVLNHRIDIVDANIDIAVGADKVYLWGAQVEESAIMSSYIPTVASTVARLADVLTLPAANGVGLGDITVVADISLVGVNDADQAVFITATHSWRNVLANRATVAAKHMNFGAGAGFDASASVAGQVERFIAVRRAGVNELWVDGVLLGTATTAEGVNALGTIQLGSNLYGHIRNFRIYDRGLIATEVGVA